MSLFRITATVSWVLFNMVCLTLAFMWLTRLQILNDQLIPGDCRVDRDMSLCRLSCVLGNFSAQIQTREHCFGCDAQVRPCAQNYGFRLNPNGSATLEGKQDTDAPYIVITFLVIGLLASLMTLWYQLDMAFDRLQYQLSHSQRQCEDQKNIIRRIQTRLDQMKDHIAQDTAPMMPTTHQCCSNDDCA